MIEWLSEFWNTSFSWATTKPLFARVALAVGLALAGIYLFCWILGMLFLFYLRRCEKREEKTGRDNSNRGGRPQDRGGRA
jgi:hypothetical protein